MNCEYCGRVKSTAKTCEGCGAPSNHTLPAIMYDSRIFSKGDIALFGRPGVNIPVDLSMLPEGRPLREYVENARRK